MANAPRPSREEVARLIALAGLGTLRGEPRQAHGGWKADEFAELILTIIPERAEKQCFALADEITALFANDERPVEFGARHCPGVPADCCDYGVIAYHTGKEVCRVWLEEDARKITDLLNAARESNA
jgi:hypothetical protein